MTRKKVYWAISDSGRTGYQMRVATPASEDNEIYSSAFANRSADVLLLWQVGPMAVEGTAIVKWAPYDKEGKTAGETGVVDMSLAGTKAAAFVGTDEHFYVVTTAAKASPSGK